MRRVWGAQREISRQVSQLRIGATLNTSSVSTQRGFDSAGRAHYGTGVQSHRHQFRVIYGDTDMMGIVYYGNYFRYFEAGRSELLRAVGLPYMQLEAAGYALPVASASAKYHASARYDELLTLETTVVAVRMGSLQMGYRLEREEDGVLIATGETLHACVGKKTGRVTRIPAMLRERLAT